MQREASQLSAQVDTLQQDLNDLRGRVDLLEGLGDRTVALEMAQEQLAADQETANEQMTALQTDMAALDEKFPCKRNAPSALKPSSQTCKHC